MLRLSRSVIALLALMLPASGALANGRGFGDGHYPFCPGNACFDLGAPFPAKRLHKFYPRLHDGLPLVDDFQTDPTEFHGVGCVSSWRPVVTPEGPSRVLARDCWSYY